jgi:hypothetical protein
MVCQYQTQRHLTPVPSARATGQAGQANQFFVKKIVICWSWFAISTSIRYGPVSLKIWARYFDLDFNILTLPGRGRKVSRARSIFCVIAIDLFGYSGAEVARALSFTPSAVSKSVVKGREDELARVIENYLMTLLERQK